MAAPQTDAGSIHDLLAVASANIRKAMVGLAHAGASPQAIKGLGVMADTLDPIVKSLAGAPEVEEAAKNGPVVGPEGEGGPQGPMAPQTPGNENPGPPAPPPAGRIPGRAPGAIGGPPPNGPFGPAAQQLHNAMRAGKSGR